eukprot:33407_1
MLYKKLAYISLATFALLTSPIIGETYLTSSNSGADYTCTETGQGSTCTIHCNQVDQRGYNFNCGTAEDCYFYCDEQKCAKEAVINASNSNNLYVIASGRECMKKSTVNAPNYGNAYLSMPSSLKGFKEMNVKSGTHTKNIIIDCDSTQTDKDECKLMNVYASTAEYLEINIANGIEFEEAIIECPVNSNYNGPSIAPCIINASNNGKIGKLTINAPNGIPKNVWIDIGSGQYIAPVTINCNLLSGSFSSTSPFTSSSSCWWTDNPTNDPTETPSYNPSITPTESHSDNPTVTPSDNPTKYPTDNPSITPSDNPSIS